MELYGQIDLTVLGDIVRNHPEAVKVVNQKDGKTHRYININISERNTPSQYGHTHYIKAGIPKASQRPDLRYYIADLKTSANSQPAAPVQQTAYSQTAPTPEPQQGQNAEPELPF